MPDSTDAVPASPIVPEPFVDAVDHPDRAVALTEAFNVRDLGGYPGVDGRSVRWRTLYRADALHQLKDRELEVLRERQVRLVLDLRTTEELERGVLQAERLGVTLRHLPVIESSWTRDDVDPDADASEALSSLYVQMLEVGAGAIATALQLLAEEPNLPALFHCTAGKDRTGVLSAIVLELLGVPEEVIVADYALTSRAMDRVVERLRRDRPDVFNAMGDQPTAYLMAPPEAMVRFLGHAHATYGSLAGYIRSIGVDDALVAELRGRLLEPADS